MSIEQLIQEHTLAVQKNTEELQAVRTALEAFVSRLQCSASPAPAIAAPAVPTAKVEHFPEQVTTIAAEDLPTAGTAADSVGKAEETPPFDDEPPFEENEPAFEITYEMLRGLGTKASIRFGRDFIVKNLAAYGANTLKDLDPKHYAEIYKAFSEGEE